MDIFKEAKKAYEDCINDLKMVSDMMANLAQKSGLRYKKTDLLAQFDVLLQYSLLQAALADNHLDLSEVQFIHDITQYGDYCSFLEAKTGEHVDWFQIYQSPEKLIKTLVDGSRNAVEDLATDFYVFFTMFDAETPYDYFRDLKNNITLIHVVLMHADGEMSFAEKSTPTLLMNILYQIAEKLGKSFN